MATKSKAEVKADLQTALDQEAQEVREELPAEDAAATEAPAIQHRATAPVAPNMMDAASQSQVGRIRAVLQQAGYSRDPLAYVHARTTLQAYKLPPTTKPQVASYLAEAIDYVLGKTQPPAATEH